ncbi:MAG: EAL domain-containing protein [Burkholderiaceae bacterium]|nr:EAL domain-containing protein [Burkholderiaceae bacterium]
MQDDDTLVSDKSLDKKNPPTHPLQSVQALAKFVDPAEKAVSFGRWWLDVTTSQLVLSTIAADLLDVTAGLHLEPESCFTQVVPDDVLTLMAALEQTCAPGGTVDCEFRVLNELDGMRWLRMLSLPRIMPGIQNGIMINITASRHAAMRERLGFESTQYLVGTQTLDEAMTRVIQSVCENLGWEWGAFWAAETDQADNTFLACKHYWHDPAYALSSLTRESCALRIAPGNGLVGHVWHTGQPRWIETSNDPALLRSSFKDSGLLSGYAFPVSYLMADGKRHSPGVLEFFSSLSRQREAQLPNLSAAIGALVAQTVQRLEQTETIRRMTQIDDMTDLANRSHFHHLLSCACTEAAAKGASFGLLYIDLDRFKPINDAFGHDAGNLVLCEFAQRLRRLAPPGSHAGRLGGDEFAILSQPITSLEQLNTLANAVLAAACQPFHVGDCDLAISASIGISVFPENGVTTPELLRNADAAMYRSKNNGRNLHSFYSCMTPTAQATIMRQLTLEVALLHALHDNEFFLEYQPVFDSFGERMLAVEALIRWRRADGEIVRPDVFIPIAEQSRLIVQIGRWVLKQTCNDLATIHRAGFAELQVNVNMAAPEFTNPDLPNQLLAVTHAAGISPNHLCLELTEGMVMQQAETVIPIMGNLRSLGFHISLDDFGMGHSSLSRLKELPISSLKIDRSFVSGLPNECGDCAIVRTIFDLGHHMHLQIIAEGVENDAQLGYLRQFGYPMMQGFLLGRPMPLAALLTLFKPDPVACRENRNPYSVQNQENQESTLWTHPTH